MLRIIFGVVAVFAIFTNAEIKNCDDKGVIFYEQFTSCKAVIEDGEKCPSKYNCPSEKSTQGKCLFQGRQYEDWEDLNKSGCNGDCRCDGESTEISCPIYDCPAKEDWKDFRPGCYQNYTLGDCCASNLICPTTDVHTCEYEGKTYKEGEKFFPHNTCYSCVCQKGFNGELVEPFCKKANCGLIDLNIKDIDNKCAPFYVKTGLSTETKLCCPIRFICGNSATVLNIKRSEVKAEEKCEFKEDFEMFVGDEFEVIYNSNKNATCKCHMPPYPACTGIYF